ncbi:MAG: N(4)-(beta-N-acetylglucosaminyl)-L-asparaginase [Candidatus Latescibacteria bacterium]|nr:N(4)-(beta-N-acetylglucosaminyl)-L-asparaginase [Candidatus Latescibacterota bacterium]
MKRLRLITTWSLTACVMLGIFVYLSTRGNTTDMKRPVIIATWTFGKACNEAAARALAEGGNALDAVEQGIWVAEADPTNASVGFGGTPNAEGVVQLDAAIMWGPGHRAGSVAALEKILHPISVARKVMEASPHVMLVGEGALKFARSHGFPVQDLTTEETKKRWAEWKTKQAPRPETPDVHDTIGMVAIDEHGDIAAGCSTSGSGHKLPGRVGDSPIIGAGLYADNDVGGAAATGLGEDIMRYCACFAVVERMRQGMSPAEACVDVLKWVYEKDPKRGDTSIGLVALSKSGEYGAAGMRKGFPYAVYVDGEHLVKEGGWVVE